MTQRWLKHVDDGFIFGWTESLAKHPSLVEVTEEEAFPERFVKQELVEKATKARKTRKVSEPALSTDDIPEAPQYTTLELSEDATRDLFE